MKTINMLHPARNLEFFDVYLDDVLIGQVHHNEIARFARVVFTAPFKEIRREGRAVFFETGNREYAGFSVETDPASKQRARERPQNKW